MRGDGNAHIGSRCGNNELGNWQIGNWQRDSMR